MATTELNKFPAELDKWAKSKETAEMFSNVGVKIAQVLIGGASGETGKDETGGLVIKNFVVSLARAIGNMDSTIALLGADIAGGLIDGCVDAILGKGTKKNPLQEKMIGGLKTFITNVFKEMFFATWLYEQIAGAVGGISKLQGSSGGLESHATGGIVGGSTGAPRLILAHGGETVLPVGETQTVNNYFSQTINTRATTDDTARGFYMMQYLARAYQ